MEENIRDPLKGIGLQFFAEPPTEPPAEPPAEPPTEPPAVKTYTQEQLNSMMANEKRTARQAILKELGFDIKDDKSFKDTLKGIKATLDAGKTQAQLDAEAKAVAETARAEAEKRALLAEAKVEVLSAGCKPEYLDDVITLALKRVSDDKNLAAVVKEMKEDSKYLAFFGEYGSSSGDKGTGGGSGFRKKGGLEKKGNLGSRLGAQVVNNTAKNPYFNN